MASTSEPPVTRPRDAQATKERLLLAAIEEFSELGLAGARIDRIAERAGANKRLIYAYFGGKDELFDAALDRTIGVVTESVPFTPDELPAYAGLLFDQIVTQPLALRLYAWRNLERPAPDAGELTSYAGKLAAIKASQKAGTIDATIPPADVMAMLMGLVIAWPAAPTALREVGDGAGPPSARRLRAHRQALVEAVARLVSPKP